MKKQTALSLISLLPLIASCGGGIGDSSSSEERVLLGDMLSKEYVVLTKATPSETETYVANELAETFYRCTDKKLEILNDANDLEGRHFISLGDTSYYQTIAKTNTKIDLSKEALNEDGFYIYTNSENVYINAYNDRGVMYGVYEFLEDTLGVKYLSHDYTYYPTSLKEVNLYSYDKAYVPLFSQRAFLNTPVFYNDYEYVAHMRFNTDYCIMPSYMGGSSLWHAFPNPAHTVGAILPYADYLAGGNDSEGNPLIKEEYREVYAHRESDGKNYSNWYLGSLDLCYTNGVTYHVGEETSTLNLMIEALKKILTEDTSCELLHVGQADVASSCPCPHCSESAGKYRSSGVMVRFMNKVEEAVNSYLRETQNGREVTFSMFAYSYNVQPPLNEDGEPVDETVIPNKRVAVKYAPIQAYYAYSLDDDRQNDNTRGQLTRWSKLGCDFMAWTYATVFAHYFCYIPHYLSMKDLLLELRNAGVIYEFDQSIYNEYGVYQQYLDSYIFSKLCWDPYLNVNDLVTDFCLYYFGIDAYENVVAYHEAMNNHFSYMESRSVTLDHVGTFYTSENYPYQFMKKVCSYFDDALSKTRNDDTLGASEKEAYIAHLEKASLAPNFTMLKFAPYYDGYNEEMISSLASDFFALCDKYGVKRYGESSNLTMANLKKEYGI